MPGQVSMACYFHQGLLSMRWGMIGMTELIWRWQTSKHPGIEQTVPNLKALAPCIRHVWQQALS
jgi:hypothetical protein